VSEVGRQLAVGVDLGKQGLGLLLGGGDGIGARGPAQRRLVLIGDRDQRLREFCGIPGCWPFIPCQTASVWALRSL
jgi:hypothetical protein